MAQTREIKRRIKSVTNTRKITKAMELVAAAKMRKAVAAVLASRDYAQRAWEMVLDLAAQTDEKMHPLLQRSKQVNKIGIILIATNRGLVGGFNAQITKAVADYVQQNKEAKADIVAEVLLTGKRGSAIHSRYQLPIVAEFDKEDVVTESAEVRPLAAMAIKDFKTKKYDKIVLAYTDYRSTLSQVPVVRELLPIDKPLTGLGETSDTKEDITASAQEFTFEPNPDAVLEAMLQRLVELQIFQAVLESNASEHSARMMAMRNASDNAQGYIDDLTLTYNQARQAAITAELADISAGSAAVN